MDPRRLFGIGAVLLRGLSNLGTVSTESNSPKLNRMTNEDYIDFLLKPINKIS